jgi:hypothetical protein
MAATVAGRAQRECPPPCPPDCTSHARWCPQRHGGGLVEVEVKSAAGRRGIAVTDQLFALIIEHRRRQDQEREHAGTEWHEGGWMFAQPTGKPIDPRRDQHEWKELLKESGVRGLQRNFDQEYCLVRVVVRGGVEPPTFRFSGGFSP